MELSACSANEWLKKGRRSQWDTSKTKEDTDVRGVEPLAGDTVFAEGLDTMLGIVDARYIQHCCPLLMVRSSEDACLCVLWGPQLFCMQAQSFCILLWPFFHGEISAGWIGRHLIYLTWNHWFIIWMKCVVLYHSMWALFCRDCSYNFSLNQGLMGLIFGSSAKRQFPLETYGFLWFFLRGLGIQSQHLGETCL